MIMKVIMKRILREEKFIDLENQEEEKIEIKKKMMIPLIDKSLILKQVNH